MKPMMTILVLASLAATACGTGNHSSVSTTASTEEAAAYVQIATLTHQETELLVQNPDKLSKKLPSALIAIAKDGRMVGSYNELYNKVIGQTNDPQMQDALAETIVVEAFQSGDEISMYTSGCADERCDSSFQYLVTYDSLNKKVLSWSSIDFIDHP